MHVLVLARNHFRWNKTSIGGTATEHVVVQMQGYIARYVKTGGGRLGVRMLEVLHHVIGLRYIHLGNNLVPRILEQISDICTADTIILDVDVHVKHCGR